LKNLKYYLNKALKEKWAFGQFNFSDFSQLKAIVSVAEKMRSPVILGTSEGESVFFGLDEAVSLRNILKKKTGLPIFLNLDHGKSFESAKKAIDAGYDMVHFDGSSFSLEKNIDITKQVVKYAKWRGVLVEGELGKIGNESSKIYSEKVEIKEENLTQPEQILEYIKKTNVALLAVSIGNFHGVNSSGEPPSIRFDILEKIKENIGDKSGLVLHGGSGIAEKDIKKSIEHGIVKININTELRKAFSESLRKFLEKNQTEITPYKILPSIQPATERIVEEKISLFGSSKKA
jgi:fructose-bisphosphate aldolase class II